MTADPDILAIQRQRRRQKRCMQCGRPIPRASLCRACRDLDWRYCPQCDALWRRTTKRSSPYASQYCPPCHSRRQGAHAPMSVYLAEQRAIEHPQLRAIVRLYRRGLTLDAIADDLGMARSALRSIIRHARTTGRWPAGLARGKDWRKGRGNAPGSLPVTRRRTEATRATPSAGVAQNGRESDLNAIDKQE